ncbi:hypothetical protein [Actinomadura rudentiformis]|uniref:Uncharacterized protein n=1 Tax=Actinomadura rudentiformis TaxID=359158 RepID=A0A6H9YM43_9ACTN|nr:hypothetical protein [Actinomadura rudentiformis]KAB2346870.1 hypothetical protein F8566_21905 [Actinomadura rudentiformis]
MIGSAMGRCMRGGFLAAACTLLALAGHSLGVGGACCLPPLPAVFVTGTVVGVLCVTVAARLLSFWKILVVVGWAQVAFHVSFAVTASGPAHHAGAVPPPSPAGAAGAPFGPSMLAGHLVAAIAAAALLAGADRALWWLLTAVFAIAVTFVWPIPRRVETHRPPWAVLVATDPAPLLGVLLARAVRRRGPPVVRPHAAA